MLTIFLRQYNSNIIGLSIVIYDVLNLCLYIIYISIENNLRLFKT